MKNPKLPSAPQVSEAARNVYKHLRDKWKGSTVAKIDAVLTSNFYLNGREKGYAIRIDRIDKSYSRQVSFAENRNSDHIVVYYGDHNDFDFNYIITDEAYKRQQMKYFNYDKAEAAAAFIFNFLTSDTPRL